MDWRELQHYYVRHNSEDAPTVYCQLYEPLTVRQARADQCSAPATDRRADGSIYEQRSI